jgi:hypothetical protein
MSHIRCPLCGKNSALSTFHPEDIELDLKLIQFHGRGRGGGFSKGEEYSVLHDESYARPVGLKVLQLTKMFIDAEMLDMTEVEGNLGIDRESENNALLAVGGMLDENKKFRDENEYLKKMEITKDRVINELNIRLNEMEYFEKQEKVKYVLWKGLALTDKQVLKIKNGDWFIDLDDEMPAYLLYLTEIYPKLSDDLREEIRKRFKANDNKVKFQLNIIWSIKREKTIAEELLGFIPSSPATTPKEVLQKIVVEAINKVNSI